MASVILTCSCCGLRHLFRDAELRRIAVGALGIAYVCPAAVVPSWQDVSIENRERFFTQLLELGCVDARGVQVRDPMLAPMVEDEVDRFHVMINLSPDPVAAAAAGLT